MGGGLIKLHIDSRLVRFSIVEMEKIRFFDIKTEFIGSKPF